MIEKVINKVVVVIVDDESQELNKEVKLLFSNGKIVYDHLSFPVEDIEEIELSLCSMRSGIRPRIIEQVLYYVDLNITINHEKHYFQIMNTPIILDVIEWIKRNHIKYTDVFDIENIFKQYPDDLARWKYINRHFHAWAKEYHLDNVRDNYSKEVFDELIGLFKDMIKVFRNK